MLLLLTVRCHQGLAYLALILAVSSTTSRATPPTKATAAVETLVTNGGVTQIGQRVTVACHLLRPSDVVMVRLLKRPLTGGPDAEVFAASGAKGALRPPWTLRRDVVFSASAATAAFNMTPVDEGSYGCRALTLEGASNSGRVQLLMALAPSTPQLFVNDAPTPATGPELLEGQTIRIRCTANVGKPSGTLALIDLGRGVHLKGDVRTWTGAARHGTATQTVYTSITTTVGIGLNHQGTKFACSLRPHQMFAKLNLTLSVKTHPISVLFPVRNIEIAPYRDNYFHGDSIECRAAGRPAASVRWTRIQGAGPLQVNGSRLYMQPGASVGYYAYTCTAANLVRGRSHKLMQSIGFHVRNRTIASTPAPPAKGVPAKVTHWVRSHHRGISVFLITFGVICGFALIAVVFAYLYSTAYGGVGGSAYGRLRDSPEDRMRFYGGDGGGGSGGGGGGGYGGSSDEDDSCQPLNKARDTNWVGTPIVNSR